MFYFAVIEKLTKAERKAMKGKGTYKCTAMYRSYREAQQWMWGCLSRLGKEHRKNMSITAVFWRKNKLFMLSTHQEFTYYPEVRAFVAIGLLDLKRGLPLYDRKPLIECTSEDLFSETGLSLETYENGVRYTGLRIDQHELAVGDFNDAWVLASFREGVDCRVDLIHQIKGSVLYCMSGEVHETIFC